MILGIDKGSAYTKTTKHKIKSIVRKSYDNFDIENIDRKGLHIILNDENYIIGEKGNFATDLLKSQHQNTEILIKTAIALSTTETNTNVSLVVGLPIAQHSKQKDRFKNMLISSNLTEIYINNTLKTFTIQNVEVFPECVGAFYSLDTNQYNDKKVLFIDIGGLSMDIASFDNKKLAEYSTHQLGIMKLFVKIANEINKQYDSQFDIWDVENILNNGLKVSGQTVRIDFINHIIQEYVIDIYQTIKLQYDLKWYDEVIFVGGGGIFLFPNFKKYIPHSRLVDNAQFANANGFQKVAEVLFDESYQNI